MPGNSARSANSTLKRNFQSFPAFNVEENPQNAQAPESSPKFSNQIQIVLQSPGNKSFRSILSNKASQSSLINSEGSVVKGAASSALLINNNVLGMDADNEETCVQTRDG